MTTQRIAGGHAPRTGAARAESAVLVAILLVVGLAAGAASFTHVHDWTMTNSPDGTPGWFGWANACISELVPVAALLDIRRRRRAGKPPGYPLALLIAAAGLSLAAQLAVAKPGVSGGLLSAVPALAFMALVKLVFATAPATAASVTTPSATGDRPATASATPGTTATEEAATVVARADGHTPDAARPQATATVDTATRAGVGRPASATATAAPAAEDLAAEDAPATPAAPADGHRPRPTSPRPRRTATATPEDGTATATATATTEDLTARVAALVADRPDVTAEDVAAEIGRAPRTARRYLAAVRADLAGVTA
ncbi:hypothetical protein [Micromonospora avicenniae]|uniref:hypothetical protein n=1 Tax=Micromonospora avicenniae TaxID=1198245 RepID=UPI003D9EC107